MTERYFHGSLSRLSPGDVIHSHDELRRRGLTGQQWSGLSAQYSHLHGEDGDITCRVHENEVLPAGTFTWRRDDDNDIVDVMPLPFDPTRSPGELEERQP